MPLKMIHITHTLFFLPQYTQFGYATSDVTEESIEDWGISFLRLLLENNAFVTIIGVQVIKVGRGMI